MKSTNNLNYRVSGNGRPVVFLHGFLESITMWEYLTPFNNFQCIFIDLPGHGASKLESGELSMESIAASVADIINELEIDSYDVIGHSMGGYVALELKKMDQACEMVVLLNSNFWEDAPNKKIDRQRVADLVQTKKDGFIQTAIPNLFMNPDKHQSDVKALIAEASHISSDAIAASSIAMSKRVDNSEFLGQIKSNVLILQGEFDAIVSAQTMVERTKELQVKVEMLPSGHMAHIEHSSLVKNALQEFLG